MKKIAVSTINRLSQYYRTLGLLIEKDTETVSSEEIADLEGVTSAQVRKDLSFFGTFGKRGLGYNTHDLRKEIGKILGLSKKWNVALIGVGNIGRALMDYEEFKKQGFLIKAAFESDPQKVDEVIHNIKVDHISDICPIIAEEKIEIAIIAVPARVAQSVVDQLVECGVRAFLNFAPISIKTPDNVIVKNENMSIELEALSYYLSHN